MTMNRPSAISRRRPKRQRTPTTLYTDNNPSTFTTKIPKGERVDPPTKPPKPSYYYVEEDVPDSSLSPKRTTSRRRKPYHKDDILETSTAAAIAASRRIVTSSSSSQEPKPPSSLPSTTGVDGAPPIKRKRGRPPKNRNWQTPAVTPLTSAGNTTNALQQGIQSLTPPLAPILTSVTPTPAVLPSLPLSESEPPSITHANAAATQSKKKKPNKVDSKKPTEPVAVDSTTTLSPHPEAWTPPIHDQMGTFLSHTMRMAPILPPVLEEPSTSVLSAASSSILLDRGLGKKTPLPQPQWSPLYNPNVYFEDDYDPETTRLPDDLTPVTRSITCMTTRKPDHAYLVVGDSMGFCIIYTLHTIIRAVARLETVACQRRARDQQERIREQQRRNRKSFTVDTSQTTIHALGMIANRVVLATSCELECMDVPSQTSLWVCPLAQDRLVTSLDMHPSRYDVLVSCSLFDNATTLGQSSPLMLLQHSQNNVEVCDANAPILLQSPCCTAIWDQSKNVENRLLFVAVANDDLELVLVQGGSIDQWKVACKTRIPVRQSNHFSKLSQSESGTYTMVACSRGIRLYQTETLQLIHVYGDQLALHGRSVVWQDCILLGNRLPFHLFGLAPDGSGNIECSDWCKAILNPTLDETTNKIAEKENTDDATTSTTIPADTNGDTKPQPTVTVTDTVTTSDLAQYIVGVAHCKGPKELTETLHVWRVEQPSVVPAMSIPLPAKSEGVQSLVAVPSKIGYDRLVLAGVNGKGHVLQPRMESNFAGIMYPPGYQVITDNLEYIEGEDQLDDIVNDPSGQQEVTAVEEEDEEEVVDVTVPDDVEPDIADDVREAMRQSLLEQKIQKELQAQKDDEVDVIHPIWNDETMSSFIPCRPEAYLRQAVNSQTDVDDDSGVQTAREMEHNGQSLVEENDSTSKNDHPPPVVPTLDPKVFVSNILLSLGHANPKIKKGAGDFSFSVTAKVVIASAPTPGAVVGVVRPSAAARHGKRSKAANLEALLKQSINPRLQRFMFSKQAMGSDGRGCRLIESATTKVPPGTVDRPHISGSTNAVNGSNEAASVARSAAPTPEPTASKFDVVGAPKFQSDEAAVALGLLGLSPNHAGAQTSDNDFASDTASRASSQNHHHPTIPGAHGYSNGRSESNGGTSSDKELLVDAPNSSNQPIKNGQSADPNCFACRGRFVIHSCGKRALPIDYDEVAKVERERRAKEEEEKKKMRAEKRRQADQRRRDARKQKQREMEERRRREEDEMRLEEERIRRMEEAIAYHGMTSTSESDFDRKRREMIVASYASHMSQVQDQEQWESTTAKRSAGEMQFHDYNQQYSSYSTTSREASSVSPPPVQWERNGAAAASIPTPPPTSVDTYPPYSGAPSQAPPQKRSASMGTLSSADALVALASFAGTKLDQPESPTMNGQTSHTDSKSTFYDSAAFGGTNTTHGFGTLLTSAATKRAIPSFEAIRGQVNGTASQPSTVSNQVSTHSFVAYESASTNAGIPSETADSNGGHLPAVSTTTTTYVWPPRPSNESRYCAGEEQQQHTVPGAQWPPSSHN